MRRKFRVGRCYGSRYGARYGVGSNARPNPLNPLVGVLVFGTFAWLIGKQVMR